MKTLKDTGGKFFVLSIVCLLLVGVIIFFSYISPNSKRNRQKGLDAENKTISSFVTTSDVRIKKAVITIPDTHILVGLEDGKGTFDSEKSPGKKAALQLTPLPNTSKFIPGVLGKNKPRLDVMHVMAINHADGKKSSIYIVLFEDRGDVALMKSYIFLGQKIITGVSASILSPLRGNGEYRLHLKYTERDADISTAEIDKEVTVSVKDGHFYEDSLVTN